MKRSYIVIACIVLVIIASIDAAETEVKKKKKKSKKVKNVQSDAAREPQAQQPTYDYPEIYDYENEYDESENGAATGELHYRDIRCFSSFRKNRLRSFYAVGS